MDEVQPRRNRRRRILLLLVPILAVLGWYGSRAVGYVADRRAYLVPSGSMAPAILPGDRIIVVSQEATPRRGEIWAISGPNSTVMIKRVIGLPGETIDAIDGRVRIDGEPLAESYLGGSTTPAMPPVHLDANQFFLMGDSRAASSDSRVWGSVHANKFLGRAEHRVWPPSRVGSIR